MTKPPPQPPEELKGVLHSLRWENPATGFKIMKLEGGKAVKGQMLEPQYGATYTFKGHWEKAKDPRYPDDFSFETYELEYPTDAKAIQKLLQVHVQGIGPVLAERLTNAYGEHTIDVLMNDPERASREIEGFHSKIAAETALLLTRNQEEHKLIVALNKLLEGTKIGKAITARLLARWKHEAVNVITANPFVLTGIHGIGFTSADLVRKNLGIPHDHPLRLQAGIMHVLSEIASKNGHTFLPQPTFYAEAVKILACAPEKLEAELTTLQEAGRIVVEPTMLWNSPSYNIATRGLWEAERLIAYQLMCILHYPRGGPGSVQPTPSLEGLAEDQAAAIQMAMLHNLLIITGPPGTGKTFTTRRLMDSFPPGTRIELAAPTGKAAKRMMEQSGRMAQTIHRLLEPIPKANGEFAFSRDAYNPLDADVVIIDECSMISAALFANLLAAIRPGTILILIGDTNQLPSVGPGNVLRDMIDSRTIPVAELTIIKRQEEGALIVRNCHAIKNGQDIQIDNVHAKDFFWQPEEDDGRIGMEIANLITNRLPSWKPCDLLRDVQVITPLKKDGALSTVELNKLLQDALNPNGPLEGSKFRLGDKVIQTKNNYGLGIFNGDMGIMRAIDLEKKEYTVAFDSPDREVAIPFRSAKLELAYAITCHKFQGSEARVVIMPIHASQGSRIMQRNWLYTAISRAREVIVCIGQASEVSKIIQRQNNARRHTNLGRFLLDPPPGTPAGVSIELLEEEPTPDV